jgi:hypothetical protein
LFYVMLLVKSSFKKSLSPFFPLLVRQLWMDPI